MLRVIVPQTLKLLIIILEQLQCNYIWERKQKSLAVFYCTEHLKTWVKFKVTVNIFKIKHMKSVMIIKF
jgi:hypothetical protein